MKKIALVIAPPFWLKTPHLGLEYIKRYLQDKARVDILDLNLHFYRLWGLKPKEWLRLDKKFEETLFEEAERRFKEDIEKLIKKFSSYDYIGFSLFRRNFNFSLNLAKKIKETLKNTKIVLGGPQTREENNLNYLKVEGEGEIPLSKIVSGSPEETFSYQEIEELDKLAFPTFQDYDFSFYKKLPLLSSRGCIRRCKFCSEWSLYKKFRQHSPLYMVELIEHLIERYGIYQFSFQDSLINANLPWLEEFCKLIINRKIKINWEAQVIIRKDMHSDLFRLMKKSGCINLFIGLESGSDKVLQEMDKGFDTSQAYEFFCKLKRERLNFEVSLIIGYPTESEEDFLKTINFLKNNKKIIPKIAQVSGFTLYKNSLLYQEYKGKPLLEHTLINKRLRKIIKFIEREKIPHKKAFIDNLRYPQEDNNGYAL